jgi:hypothetical protein
MIKSSIVFFVLITRCISSSAQDANVDHALSSRFDLSRDHSKEPQEFIMQTQVWKIAADGKRVDTTIYTVHLKSMPATPGQKGDEFTCVRFTIQSGNGNEVSIPSLSGWKHFYQASPKEKDDKGQLFGIDHSTFDNLKDSNGKSLSVEKSYLTYNVFIDFHSMFVFSDRSDVGKGVQDLHQVGDKIIHSAAYSTPPVNLGNQIKEGSVFRNGEITLEFKGISRINDRSCALLGYDSGASSFTMMMQFTPSTVVNTNGSSHYWGDIYKDLQSGWIQRATLHELVVSETVIGTAKVPAVIERSIEVKNVRR